MGKRVKMILRPAVAYVPKLCGSWFWNGMCVKRKWPRTLRKAE
ncbi:hypothetical protein HMPREF3213_01397 [Heyndrickxia coagulans]|uniref:Uncharacterized protein n=1 Tax=Heyndrickxia coagulans TaxID=1398 RepID=A0A133KTL8_HEYCO|nr:hypothetical protein HMPREF3213_01397 [Heyndrickxia coagulans]